MDANRLNEDLIRFWDSALTLSDEQKEEERKGKVGDYRDLAPSPKLCAATSELGGCHKVLDYGCGSGWASIVAAKSGCRHVDAVDVGANIIDTTRFYAELYGVAGEVHPQAVATDWLNGLAKGSYDGIVCSNVLDVVPLEVAKGIIKELARVARKDARVVIGLNFYLSPEAAKSRNMELIEGRYLIVNGVLRLNSMSDEEWAELFAPYFRVEELEHFAWPGEEAERRRLFRLALAE